MSAGLTNQQWWRLNPGDKIVWPFADVVWMVVGRVTVPKGYTSHESVAIRGDHGVTLLLMRTDGKADIYEPQFIVVAYRPEWSKA